MLDSPKKFVRGIYLNNHIYRFYSSKYGIYVKIDNKKVYAHFYNMREAFNWVKSYNEFVIGIYK